MQALVELLNARDLLLVSIVLLIGNPSAGCLDIAPVQVDSQSLDSTVQSACEETIDDRPEVCGEDALGDHREATWRLSGVPKPAREKEFISQSTRTASFKRLLVRAVGAEVSVDYPT